MRKILLLVPLLLQACFIQPKPSKLVYSDAVYREIASSSADYSVNAKTADRRYVESVLNQVFDIPSTETAAISGVYQRKEFGGSCDLYAAGENADASNVEFRNEFCFSGIGRYLPAYSNPARYSYTMKTCETLITNLARFTSAMQKVYPSWAGGNAVLPAADAAAIARAYDLFYRTDTPDAELTNAFLAIAQSSPTTNEAWKRILITLCDSPEWQNF